MLYGALDNDDMFMYMGGLAAAVRSVDGKTPDMVVTNTRNPAKPEMTSMDKFIGQEFRSRYVNPTWIQGMQKEGYAGAGEMKSFVEYLWGWDATTPELVNDDMWKETFDVYVDDKHKLGMKDFFEKNSPYAYQDVTARMVETIRKNYWKADEATEKKLITEYLESVNKHGVGCAEHTCGNPRLSKYVMERAKSMGIPVPAIEGFQKAMEKAIGKNISDAAKAAEQFVQKNESPAAGQTVSQAPAAPSPQQQGVLMEEEQRSAQAKPRSAVTATGDSSTGVFIGVPLLALLLFWRQRESRRLNG
jgi:cobaltochelatase CobN